MGAVYRNLSVGKVDRLVLVYWFITFVRRVGIAYAITFGTFSLVAQLFFVNFSSLFMMGFIGLARPYNSTAENVLELVNEFTVLMVYCHLICQTEFVQDMAGRQLMGWSLIFVVVLNMLINFGNILAQNLMTLYLKIKFYFLKKKILKQKKLIMERRLQA